MAPIGIGLKVALLEAFTAASELVPANLQSGFILIGGTSLLPRGSSCLFEATCQDSRFSKTAMESWEYQASNGINISFEFLTQGGGFVPIRASKDILLGGAGLRAGLGELAIMKARTWLARDKEKDLEDLMFLIAKMHELREGFQGVVLDDGDEEKMGDLKALKTAAGDAGGRYEVLLQEALDSRL
ncbi:MAG: hypothetical protein M1829_002559 [Trizodia sp. TS-e1964]|nr:MAG: hypothetical protein M1829_002559 [Trizodia sp. TS-e1964]